jgi:hypothetical protein
VQVIQIIQVIQVKNRKAKLFYCNKIDNAHLDRKDTTMSSHLSTTYRQQVTWNGHKADVMKSGLQKYIRRGVVDKALFCAGELDLFKEAPEKGEAEGIRTNFLHRLIVIFQEEKEKNYLKILVLL